MDIPWEEKIRMAFKGDTEEQIQRHIDVIALHEEG